jgi:hypothetical protein
MRRHLSVPRGTMRTAMTPAAASSSVDMRIGTAPVVPRNTGTITPHWAALVAQQSGECHRTAPCTSCETAQAIRQHTVCGCLAWSGVSFVGHIGLTKADFGAGFRKPRRVQIYQAGIAPGMSQ